MATLRGACPCGVVVRGESAEADLRSHVARTHPEAFHDDDGLIVVERHTSLRKAWHAINRGVPVLISAPGDDR